MPEVQSLQQLPEMPKAKAMAAPKPTAPVVPPMESEDSKALRHMMEQLRQNREELPASLRQMIKKKKRVRHHRSLPQSAQSRYLKAWAKGSPGWTPCHPGSSDYDSKEAARHQQLQESTETTSSLAMDGVTATEMMEASNISDGESFEEPPDQKDKKEAMRAALQQQRDKMNKFMEMADTSAVETLAEEELAPRRRQPTESILVPSPIKDAKEERKQVINKPGDEAHATLQAFDAVRRFSNRQAGRVPSRRMQQFGNCWTTFC